MRWLVLFMLVGCTFDSASARLYDLEGRTPQCGNSSEMCTLDANVPAVVSCMNDALSAGTQAQAAWTDESTIHNFHVFTEGDHFHLYITKGDEFDGPVVLGENTCPGPLATTQTAACGVYLQFQIGGC
jgi:hypothetical protein